EPSNFRSPQWVDDYLGENNVIGIEGIGNRALVRRIRVQEAMTGVLSTEDWDDASLIVKAQCSPSLVGQDLVKEVLQPGAIDWHQPLLEYLDHPSTPRVGSDEAASRNPDPSSRPHVVAIDYGMKWNIPRHLAGMGCRVTVVPGT